MPDDTSRPAVTLTPAQIASRNETRRVTLDRFATAVALLEREGDAQTRLLPEDFRNTVRASIRDRIASLRRAMADIQAAETEAAIVDIYRNENGRMLVWGGGLMSGAGAMLQSPGFAYRRDIGRGIGLAARAVAGVIGDALGAAAESSGLATAALVVGGLWLLSQGGKARETER